MIVIRHIFFLKFDRRLDRCRRHRIGGFGLREFFDGVGTGDRAGVWEDVPVERPEFRAETKRQVIKMIKKRKAEEMI